MPFRAVDGSCVWLQPKRPNHVCSYEFVQCRTADGCTHRMLNIIDQYTREVLTIVVKRKLGSADVVNVLTDLLILRDLPAYIRSDNGPELIAIKVRQRIENVGAKTAHVKPVSPWE